MTASAWLLLVVALGGVGWAGVFIEDELHWRHTDTHPTTGGTDVSAPPTQQ